MTFPCNLIIRVNSYIFYNEDKKHATKQIHRLLSNKKLKVWDIAENWVPYVIGGRKEIEVALDWVFPV
jgi:hypothetical protein